MRMIFSAVVLMTLAQPAHAADLAETRSNPVHGPDYGALWAGREPFLQRDYSRPPRRVLGGPGYVGDNYGLGKPPYSGVGPRPDWGRSSYD